MVYEHATTQSSISNYLLMFLGVVLVVMIAWSVIVYNRIVEKEYAIARSEKTILALKTKNADLHDSLYGLTEFHNLMSAGESQGLMKVRNPQYVLLPTPSQELSLAR